MCSRLQSNQARPEEGQKLAEKVGSSVHEDANLRQHWNCSLGHCSMFGRLCHLLAVNTFLYGYDQLSGNENQAAKAGGKDFEDGQFAH